MEPLPDFVKLAESFGASGIQILKPNDLDEAINEMISIKGPVICDVVVDPMKTASNDTFRINT